MRKRRTRRDTTPMPSEFAAVRRGIRRTATRLNCRLSRESIEDLMQEVFLRLWKCGTEGKLRDCPAYVGRVAASATIDMLRGQSAKKRRELSVAKLHPKAQPRQHARTPEEIVLAREEAWGVPRTNQPLRFRVKATLRRLERRGVSEGYPRNTRAM